MNQDDLQQGLSAARNGPECVAVVAGYLESYELAYGHGTDNAADEAYWLVRAVQSWDDDVFDRQPDGETLATLVAFACRRALEHVPVAYLVNEAWFAGLWLYVDERVLVPRSPLAELIIRQFAPWLELRTGDRVLDLGTGSGCLAIGVAHHCPGVSVDAIEVSSAAAAVARRNIDAHEIGDCVRLFEGDLFEAVAGPYRIILSNPPYVPDARISELPAEYAHEPEIALAGGSNGLAVVDRILSSAPDYLADDGVLIVEVGEAAQQLVDARPHLPATWLDFEAGGGGVFLLTRDELTGYLAS